MRRVSTHPRRVGEEGGVGSLAAVLRHDQHPGVYARFPPSLLFSFPPRSMSRALPAASVAYGMDSEDLKVGTVTQYNI